MERTWFITSANSGFGRPLSERLPERGHRGAATVHKPDAHQDSQRVIANG